MRDNSNFARWAKMSRTREKWIVIHGLEIVLVRVD